MTAVKEMLAVVLLGLCVVAGVAHGFVVEQVAGDDSAWQFSTVNGNARGGRLMNELENFQIKGFRTYDAGVAGSGDGANANQFSVNTFTDFPEQFSTRDFKPANQFQEQEGQFATQGSNRGSSGDEGYDYNQFSTLPVGFSADRKPSTASYVLGDSQKREEARPEYAYHARAGRNGASGASFTSLDVQGASDGQAVSAKQVGTTAAPAGESRPSYVYDARAGKGGSVDGASFTTTKSVHHESSADQAVPVKGHEGPISYYTPSSDRNGAFVFYDTRSDAQKNLVSTVDGDSATAASFASSGTTSATTASILATQQPPQGIHGCPNS